MTFGSNCLRLDGGLLFALYVLEVFVTAGAMVICVIPLFGAGGIFRFHQCHIVTQCRYFVIRIGIIAIPAFIQSIALFGAGR